jgi:osmotically-inducible protein OsmY
MLTNRARGRAALLAAFALVCGFAVTRAQEQPPAPKESVTEKVKDKLDAAARSIKKGAQSAADAVKEQYHRARESVHGLGEHGRIYARLHWDKNLQGAKIEIAVKGPVATLTGTVPDTKAKAKALELTQDTVGITEVVDHLRIEAVKSEADRP